MTMGRGQQIHRRRNLSIFLAMTFLSEVAASSQAVAIGWTVYNLSNAPISLGVVGLVEFVPMTLFMLPAGEICDRGDPRRVLLAGLALQLLCAGGFLALTWLHTTGLWPFYSVLVLSGTGRAFAEPARQALLSLLVPPRRLPEAIAWGACVWQVAVIAGPTLGGLAYAYGPITAYTICCCGFLAALLAVETVAGRRSAPVNGSTVRAQINRIRDGMRFVRSCPVLIGAISLDLVSVLLGGATALLPIYARDILQAGPIGLGLLRSAPAVGAGLVALYQVRHPPDRHVGLQLFAAVAVFGVATVVFGLSTSLDLSIAALFVIGAADMLSVNIRSSLVQLAAPHDLRGRVSAVHMLFVGTSSELGAFESGLLSSLIGTVPCVVIGGIGVVIAAVVWIRLFPALRRVDRIAPAES